MAKALADRSSSELEDRIGRLAGQVDRVERSLEELKHDRQRLLQELQAARQALAARLRSPKEPAVSAHALLRYLERVLEIDVKGLERSLLSPDVKAAIRAGATRIAVNGVDLVVKDNVIVTVID